MRPSQRSSPPVTASQPGGGAQPAQHRGTRLVQRDRGGDRDREDRSRHQDQPSTLTPAPTEEIADVGAGQPGAA
jgi:hypothetical protein